MSELLIESTPEVKLYPGIINETVQEALGIHALIPLVEVEGV